MKESGKHKLGRDSQSAHEDYLAQMDVTMVQKIAFCSAHFNLHSDARILDMGCGSGLGSYIFARLNPDAQVVGIDINDDAIRHAKAHYQLSNLSFVKGDIESYDFGDQHFDAVLNSSVLHEVYSYTGYKIENVKNVLRAQMNLLKPGGVILIRDFVKPDRPDDMIILDVRDDDRIGDMPVQMSAPDLLLRYAVQANALSPETHRGFYVEELESVKEGWRRFRLPQDWANEFVLRKDYRESFSHEINEKYGYFTAQEFQRFPNAIGLRVVYSAPYWNPWIVNNRFKDQIQMSGENGEAIATPPTNFVAVLQKPRPGQATRVYEHRMTEQPANYLQIESFRNKTGGAGYDMVSRPGGVCDVLPYQFDRDGRLVVFAKSGYPRPLVNMVQRNGTPNLDRKTWSGHLVEPLAIAYRDGDNQNAILNALEKRAGFKQRDIQDVKDGLVYYTSPAVVNERVQSFYVHVDHDAKRWDMDACVSGFSDSGEITGYYADDLLRGAQVGMLPEARLEMNIYGLMRQAGYALQSWIGGVPDIPTQTVENKTSVAALLRRPKSKPFLVSKKSADYVHVVRSRFVEDRTDGPGLAQEFEAILLNHNTTNSAFVLPAVKDKTTGEVMVGVELREFPSVQKHDGDATHITLPGFRLPQSVTNMDQTIHYLSDRMNAKSEDLVRLGEGYFPSIGIMPERAFPFVVTQVDEQLKSRCHFVPLHDLYTHQEHLKDAHLMIVVNRLVHALGLWENYQKPYKPDDSTPKIRDNHNSCKPV